MDAGSTGGPGFNFPHPPMNFPGNMPNSSYMAGPRMNQGYGMQTRPVHNRPHYHHDVQFAESPQFQEDVLWFGSFKKKRMKKKNKNKEKVPDIPQNPQPKKKKSKAARKKAKAAKDAANYPQNQKVISQLQYSAVPGAAKNPQQPMAKVANQAQSSGAVAVKNPQQQKPINASQAKKSGAENPQQPSQPGVCRPANSGDQQQKRTGAQNGDTKKHKADGQTPDADLPSQPHKKLKTEEVILPAELRNLVNNYGWRGDTSKMFSCSLCRYHTPDKSEIGRHFFSYQHREILRHLYIFFPKDRVDFLHKYLLFKKKKMAMEQDDNIQPIRDNFKGIGPEHYFHRIQAAQCLACDVLIPDVPELLTVHVQSDVHRQNCKATAKDIKFSSLTAAKELLLNKDVLQMLKRYNMGQNPFKDVEMCSLQGQNHVKDIAGCSSQISNTHEVLVAEEDDDDDDDEDTNGEDAIADTKDGQEISVTHNEGPAHEYKDSGNKMVLPIEPEIMEPDHTTEETPSMTVNTVGTIQEEETEEEAAEAP